MSDTPRAPVTVTDTVQWGKVVDAEDYFKLERELSDLRATLAAAEKDAEPLKSVMSLNGEKLLARFYDYDYFYRVTSAIEKERGNV